MSNPKLPKYNPDAKCPKCDYLNVNSVYCEEPQVAEICYEFTYREAELQEHIHRTCQCCHYEWLEAALSAE